MSDRSLFSPSGTTEEVGINKTYYLGVDPGANGGLCILEDCKGTTRIYDFYKMPANDHDLLTLLQEMAPVVSGATIETIGTGIYGGKAASNLMKLYGNYCRLKMGMVAAKIPFEEVSSTIWKRKLGIEKRGKSESSTAWKNRLKSEALRLYPVNSSRITLATADAILIATFGLRLQLGRIQ